MTRKRAKRGLEGTKGMGNWFNHIIISKIYPLS